MKKLEIIRKATIILMLIALSVGNIINYRSITVYKVGFILLIFIYLYIWLKTRRKLNWNVFFTLLSILIVANFCMFGVIKNPHPVREKLFFIGRLVGHGVVIFLLYNLLHGKKTDEINKYILPILYLSSSLNVLVNVIQIINDKLLPGSLQIVKKKIFIRATGLFMDPNYNGYFICMCIFLLFFIYENKLISKKVFIILLVANVLSIFLTLSFGTILGFFIAGIIILVIGSNQRIRILTITVTCVIMITAAYFYSSINDIQITRKESKKSLKNKIIYYTNKKLISGSGGYRLDQYQVSFNAFKMNPLFGIGTIGFMESNNYKKYSYGNSLRRPIRRAIIIHSNIFAILGENGLAGIVPYLGLISIGMLYSWRLYKKEKRYLYIFGMQVASLIISSTINTIYFNFFWFVLFLPFLYYKSEGRWNLKWYMKISDFEINS